MCLDNIEEIAAAVEAAKVAKDNSARFETDCPKDAESTTLWADGLPMLTVGEIRLIHARRIEAAESRLRDLGFRGPVVKPAAADPGDAQRNLASNRTGEAR